jgi:hypothetical protein
MSNATDMQATCTKVSNLVRLASNESTPPEEARNAALAATQAMASADLVVVPRSELERIKTVVEGASKLAKAAKEEKRNNLIMGAVAGFAASKMGFLGK